VPYYWLGDTCWPVGKDVSGSGLIMKTKRISSGSKFSTFNRKLPGIVVIAVVVNQCEKNNGYWWALASTGRCNSYKIGVL